MFTWDSVRRHTESWPAGASTPRRAEQGLSGYFRQIDRLFYGAVAALAASLVLLLVG